MTKQNVAASQKAARHSKKSGEKITRGNSGTRAEQRRETVMHHSSRNEPSKAKK